jgi:hypothetical protein
LRLSGALTPQKRTEVALHNVIPSARGKFSSECETLRMR